jgi:hypothetical protein
MISAILVRRAMQLEGWCAGEGFRAETIDAYICGKSNCVDEAQKYHTQEMMKTLLKDMGL